MSPDRILILLLPLSAAHKYLIAQLSVLKITNTLIFPSMSHLDLQDKKAYRAWADAKLRAYDQAKQLGFARPVDVEEDGQMDEQALFAIRQQIGAYNLALYKLPGGSDDTISCIKRIGSQAGLREDLARLGFERNEDVKEPEDHAAILCEVMAALSDEDGGFSIKICVLSI